MNTQLIPPSDHGAQEIALHEALEERYLAYALSTIVNRALPDAELDGFVDVLARRIAAFDRRAIAAAKKLVNEVSLPSADQLLDALNSFQTALTWAETGQRIEALLKRGLQQDSDFERRWPAALDTLLEPRNA